MASLLEKITLKLDLQGFEQIQGLGRTFKKLETNAVLSQRQIKGLRTAILGVGNGAKNTIGGLNAQVDALTRVRESARIGSRQFNLLTQEIIRVKAAIDSANSSMNKSKFGRKDFMQGLGIAGGAMAFGGPLPGAAGLIGGGINKAMGGSFKEGATAGVGVGFAAKPVVDAIGGTATYAADIEKGKIALKGITKDAASYQLALEAVETAVNDYNVPQEIAIQGMTRLSAAVLGSGGNINNATEAFLNTTAAIKGTAGSAEDVKSAITAMVQIFSKGKVSAEELSGQLGERFPAAVTKFAKANNISTQQLQKNLKDGTVGLDMLSKFIESLGAEYAPLAKKIAASNEEAGARSRIAMNRLRIAVGDNLRDVGAEFQILGAQMLVDIIPAVTKIAEIGAVGFGALAEVVKFVVENFHILSPVIVGATVALIGFNLQAAIANKSGIVLMARNAVTGIMNLRTALIAATASQATFNATVKANVYVIAATAIASIATALWQVRNQANLLNEEGSLFAADQLNAKEAARELKLIEDATVRLRDAIANPENYLDDETFRLLGASTRDEIIAIANAALDQNLKGIDALKARILKVTGKAEYDPLGGGDGKENPLEKFAKEGFKITEQLESAFVGAFTKMEDALVNFAKTGKLEFGKLVQSIRADMLKIAIRATITQPLMKAFNLMADGGVIAGNNIVPYRKGGVVGAPTMFQYGGSKLGIMGEAGPEAIMPLKRGPSGKLGVEMHGGGGGGRATNVNYTGPTLNFNGDEYVPKSAVGGIINAAAKQGASMGQTSTMRSLQNNRSARSRIGM